MMTQTIPPILLNLTIPEIAVLTSPHDRAEALTFSELDPTDEQTRELIRSVNVPEAGELGAALQRLLLPATEPTPRPRRKRAVKAIPEAVRRETRGNLFEALAKVADDGLPSVGGGQVGTGETDVAIGTGVSASRDEILPAHPVRDTTAMTPVGEVITGPAPHEGTATKADAGAPRLTLGMRLRALFAGHGAEPAPSR